MATVLLDLDGFRIVTDPVLDAAGTAYTLGATGTVRYINTQGPTHAADDLPKIDLALVSHDHHKDNLDRNGRDLLKNIPLTLTTPIGAKRLSERHGISTLGLAPWQTHTIALPDQSLLKITATPARHGPPVVAKVLAGDVIGFVLESPHFKKGALYFTGDTRLYKGVRQVAAQKKIGTVLMNLGAGRFSPTGPICYSMPAKEGAETAELFEDAAIVPLHFEGWSHLSEGRADVEAAFAERNLQDRLIWLPRGMPHDLKT